MPKYLVKETYTDIETSILDGRETVFIRDKDSVVREVKGTTDSGVKPPGYILLEGPYTDSPKISTNEKGELVIIEDTSVKAVKDKTKEVDLSVIGEASKVFNTTNLSNIFARVDSYSLRAFAPEKYLDQNLIATKAIGAFSIDDPLDTVEKIKDYYLEILVSLDKFRLAKVKELKAVKDGA